MVNIGMPLKNLDNNSDAHADSGPMHDVKQSSPEKWSDDAVLDPDVINFDGPDDPENPINWSSSRKAVVIAMVTLMTLLSPIGSTISSSAVADIKTYFNATGETLLAFATTIYVLGYAFGPIMIAPLSEMYGRAILYKICIVLFLIFNVACAVANNLSSLIVLRLLAGIAGSCPVTLGTGSIADMVPQEKRAGAMAGYVIGAVLGPSIGPIVGGYLTPRAGWRWAFWLMAIATAPLAVVVVLFMQESYPFVLIKRKTERLRRETGNMNLCSALDTGRTPSQLFAFSILRPLKMLLLPIVFALSLYAAVVYSYLYLCFTTFPQVFGEQYGFGSGASGLATLGIGVGSIFGVFFCGAVSDKLSAYLTKEHGGSIKPEYRLPMIVVGGICVPIGLFWYAWTAENKVHWIAPIIGTGFLGGGMIITYMASTLYLVDAYTVYSASVTASSTIFRCLCATFLPLAGPAMYGKLGVGWGTSLLGFIAVAFIPLPFIFYIYGQRLRESKRLRIDF
ncbi:cycloheximide resistance protein [Nannizzia gypsea CBS 118893]|uniref:Cycloheximide resistance protein n=1 Tax=Arthroderma gypseum (strain ATCC MYA-4604 / CBS 118893) TaxID=535722 RepID=E4UPH8_ARTGP|nr:cycloheximide resistance protein [Nannizzia gypsea CBS 118893]EFQ99853.1 cycloheximide resistance protein [Nannizzia gypsea CBS 118893]